MDDFQSNLLDGLERRTEHIAERVLEWVRDVQPALVSGVSTVTGETPPLPLAIVETTGFTAAPVSDDRFPELAIQELEDLTIYTVQILLGHDNADEEEADHFLKRTAARLSGSLRYDGTLGGRVHRASRQVEGEFGDLFVEYEDGVRARAAALTIFVADRDTEGSWA